MVHGGRFAYTSAVKVATHLIEPAKGTTDFYLLYLVKYSGKGPHNNQDSRKTPTPTAMSCEASSYRLLVFELIETFWKLPVPECSPLAPSLLVVLDFIASTVSLFSMER